MAVDYQLMFNDGFLDRAKRMSGLKTDDAFAGAIGVSKDVLTRARRTGVATTTMLVGLCKAFGFQPGEVAKVRRTDAVMETTTAA